MQVQFSLEWQCQYAYELGMREAAAAQFSAAAAAYAQ